MNDIRMRELTRWQEAKDHMRAAKKQQPFPLHRHQEKVVEHFTATAQQMLMQAEAARPRFDRLREQLLKAMADSAAMANIPPVFLGVEAGQLVIDDYLNMSPIKEETIADELFDSLFRKPKLNLPVASQTHDQIARRVNYVRPSDTYGIVAAEDPIPAVKPGPPMKSNVKPAIAGLGTMTPMLVFNSKRDCRI